jgi:flagellar basal-body rod protein FlgG
MQHVFAVALASMHHDMSRLDRIALNLANVSTPGYRREVVAVRPFVEVLDAATPPGAAVSAPGTIADDPARGPAIQVLTDVRAGTVRMTGQPLDLAIAGDAFFEVATENGPAYTRQGSFRVDERGRLVTPQGHAVMGTSGEIFLATRTPVIDASGNVTEPDATTGPAAAAPGEPVARLKLVRFQDPARLERLGAGLVAAGAGMTLVADGQARVQQGALENANVSSMQEMVQLMETMRHFESIQRVAQGYDEMLGTAIRRLGDLG